MAVGLALVWISFRLAPFDRLVDAAMDEKRRQAFALGMQELLWHHRVTAEYAESIQDMALELQRKKVVRAREKPHEFNLSNRPSPPHRTAFPLAVVVGVVCFSVAGTYPGGLSSLQGFFVGLVVTLSFVVLLMLLEGAQSEAPQSPS